MITFLKTEHFHRPIRLAIVIAMAFGLLPKEAECAVSEYTTSGSLVNPSLIAGRDTTAIGISGDELFVSGYGPPSTFNNNEIGTFSTTGVPLTVPLISKLDGAFGIAISGSDLFVANYGGKYIGEYTTSGATINASLISLYAPIGIAVSGDDLFVVNRGTDSVGEYTTSGATVNATLFSVSDPGGIAIAGDDLFITTDGSGVDAGLDGFGGIAEYTIDGSTVNPTLVTGLNNPFGIAVSGNDLFVANFSSGMPNETTGSIGEYTADGTTVDAALIAGLNSPFDLAVAGDDLYVAGIENYYAYDSGSTGELLTLSLAAFALLGSRIKTARQTRGP
jgi:hypothetical protein